MKIYNHTGVNYMTDIFSDLKSFDVVGTDELLILHEKLAKIFPQSRWGFSPGSFRMANGPAGSVLVKGDIHYPQTYDTMMKLGGEYLYLELPHKFFDDYLIGWTHDICMIDTDNEKRENCDCYKCINIVGYSWKEVKQNILTNKTWVAPSTLPAQSYYSFRTFDDFGIAKPIYNYSPHWPTFGTHRIVFCSVLKSDVPFFFRINDDNENVYRGMMPYFKDKKYCHMKIMKNKKKVAFYLSSYWSNFDEDRDEKIGEISYK